MYSEILWSQDLCVVRSVRVRKPKKGKHTESRVHPNTNAKQTGRGGNNQHIYLHDDDDDKCGLGSHRASISYIIIRCRLIDYL